DWLPAVINMDEVKSTKDAKGSMSFVFMDGIRCEFLDILESRTLYDLENYFRRYTKKARESVKVIVTDMNYTYPKLAESIFPNAIVVTDRFHIVNSVIRGFTRVRIRIMKSYAPSNMKYKALKRYWRLFLKPNEKLDFKKYSNYINIPGSQTENSVVEYLLDINEELREAYNQLQTVMSAVRYRDIARLETVLDGKDNGSEEMTKALNALVENRESVDNALRYEFSNGPMEGINNKIKVIKRVAYGFGCFTSFRVRIHLAFGLKKIA
ncbi:ISL3 family transposase, partial [Levilactobacillus parabrevis]